MTAEACHVPAVVDVCYLQGTQRLLLSAGSTRPVFATALPAGQLVRVFLQSENFAFFKQALENNEPACLAYGPPPGGDGRVTKDRYRAQAQLLTTVSGALGGWRSAVFCANPLNDLEFLTAEAASLPLAKKHSLARFVTFVHGRITEPLAEEMFKLAHAIVEPRWLRVADGFDCARLSRQAHLGGCNVSKLLEPLINTLLDHGDGGSEHLRQAYEACVTALLSSWVDESDVRRLDMFSHCWGHQPADVLRYKKLRVR